MARVLKLEEIPRTYGKTAVWIEMRGFRKAFVSLYKDEYRPWLVFVSSTQPDDRYLDTAMYRIKWRAWNRRPDEAEMEAEAWCDQMKTED